MRMEDIAWQVTALGPCPQLPAQWRCSADAGDQPLSGERISLKVEPHQTVADVIHLLETSFRAPILALLTESGRLSPKTRRGGDGFSFGSRYNSNCRVMGCGATRVAPDAPRAWRPPAPRVEGTAKQVSTHGVVPGHRAGPPTVRTARTCNFASLECRNAEVQISRSSQRALSQPSSLERRPRKDRVLRADPRIPTLVVDGSDLVDLDDQDLLDLLSSWEGQRPYVPPGMRVPCAPDRRKHEEHLDKLNGYRAEVSTRPQTVTEDVELKRWDHERLLDNLYLSEGE
eukprot:s1025_g18.t1